MPWTPEGYARFAIDHQLPALWTLAHYMRREAGLQGTPLGPQTRVLDFGAGPGFTGRLLKRLTGAQVVAAVQPEFTEVALTRSGCDWLDSVEIDIIGTETALEDADSFDFGFCYGSFHEFDNPRRLASRLGDAIRPEGMLVIIDTLKDTMSGAEELPGGPEAAEIAQEIRETFAVSLSADQVVSLDRCLGTAWRSETLAISEDVTLEAELSYDGPESRSAVEGIAGEMFALVRDPVLN